VDNLQKYRICNNFTGSTIFFGDSKQELIDIAQITQKAWELKLYSLAHNNNFKSEYRLDEIYYVLEENNFSFHLQNTKTGIKFWVGGWFSKPCLRLIPIP
jgi:hypothetical protein